MNSFGLKAENLVQMRGVARRGGVWSEAASVLRARVDADIR
eukprot:SAG31_NODE_4325_length_3355_cov_2.346130_3_plen_41_part_00